MIKSAIIGFGGVAEVHAAAIKSLANAKLIAVCDTNPAKEKLIPEGAAFYSGLEDLLAKEKPDAVHTCLPHYLHYPVAKRLAEVGINVFAEKPLALNAEEGGKFIQLEGQYGVKICLCFQNRLNSTTETLLKFLRGGEYGKIIGIRGSVMWFRSKDYYSSGPWRSAMAQSGGGCMINQAIHTIDLMQLFAGSPVASVKGTIGQALDYGLESDIEDSATARIVFENGTLGLFASSLANFTDEQVEIKVQCEKADFLIKDQKLVKIPKDGSRGETLTNDVEAFAGKPVYGAGHLKLIERFYQAIETGNSSYIHPEEGLPALRIIDAIRQSSKTGKTVYF